MSSQLYSGSKTVAYFTLILSKKDFQAFREYCKSYESEVDTFAEEVALAENSRPMLNHVFDLIEQKKIKTLIIPSLEHMLGTRFKKPSQLLNYLERHNVWLHSLVEEEIIPSSR